MFNFPPQQTPAKYLCIGSPYTDDILYDVKFLSVTMYMVEIFEKQILFNPKNLAISGTKAT